MNFWSTSSHHLQQKKAVLIHASNSQNSAIQSNNTPLHSVKRFYSLYTPFSTTSLAEAYNVFKNSDWLISSENGEEETRKEKLNSNEFHFNSSFSLNSQAQSVKSQISGSLNSGLQKPTTGWFCKTFTKMEKMNKKMTLSTQNWSVIVIFSLFSKQRIVLITDMTLLRSYTVYRKTWSFAQNTQFWKTTL